MHTTDAPFVDTSAADLAHQLGLGALPALASLRLDGMELHVLGASHQVRVGDWSETVACLPGRPGHLPPAVATPGYRFASHVYEYDRDRLTARVRGIKARAQGHPHGLAVAFQGDALALTAMTAEVTAAGMKWMTWHVYPQHGQIVQTRSTLQRQAR